ncbi:uncharacterized protein LOC135683687 [Rhopilema esculentum]|uniref:uncharacterized protein LOC135683687 n=1 Tax=Rhopilema esculentum TaxID=499914 RepID=UPI0031D9953D
MDQSTSTNESSQQVKKRASLGKQCAAFGCYNFFYSTDRSPTGLRFFKFPQKNPEKRQWCNLIKRVDGLDGFRVTASTYLCHEHFTDSDIKKNPQRWKLRSGALPSLKLHEGNRLASSTKTTRKAPTDRSSFVFESVSDVLDSMENTVSTQTNLSFINRPIFLENPGPGSFPTVEHGYSQGNQNDVELVEFVNLKEKVEELSQKVADLNDQLSSAKKAFFSVEKLQDDDSAVKFYTGFPSYFSFQAVFEYLKPKLENMSYWRGTKSTNTSTDQEQEQNLTSKKRGPKRRLSQLDEFLFVLMRLKVGLFLSDLADRFGISVGHASKIFTTWINFLFHELPLLFPYPSKDLVASMLPAEFKNYPSTRIILDCTEIHIEVPSSLRSQSQTWSEYKHHNTWKALIGISPNGAITFISKLWSGRVSDKELTSSSGLLSLLEPGDNVMADRGFDIANILPPGVTLNIPPFKGSRDQLTPAESEETAKIAAVRIHVERAIGRVKNYHILDGVLPLSLAPVANQIFTVCCLLTNFLPFLVNPQKNDN